MVAAGAVAGFAAPVFAAPVSPVCGASLAFEPPLSAVLLADNGVVCASAAVAVEVSEVEVAEAGAGAGAVGVEEAETGVAADLLP